MSAERKARAVISLFIDPLPESVATAPAKAPSDPDISHCPARVAEAFSAPTISAESPPIPESVATADRISPRFALLISPLPDNVDSIFTHKAPDPVKDPDPCIHTLLPSPHILGGSFQEYGAEYPLGTQYLSATHTIQFSQ